MVDLITLVISGAFGAGALVVILGFYLALHRNRGLGGQSTYETRDYFAQYGPRRSQDNSSSSSSKHSYDSSFRRPFRSDSEIEANARRVRQNARTIMIVIIVIALIAVIIAGYYDPTNLILLIFLLPIAISFLRSRRTRNPQEEQDQR